jgi:class 3 adenylate cyclase
MVTAIFVAFLMGRTLTRSLHALTVGASRIGTMHLDHRIEVRSRDEIGTVAAAFNDMASNLAAAQQQLTAAHDAVVASNAENERQRRISESLLTNILPETVAAELGTEGKVAPRYYDQVTILFTDFVGFTPATEQLPAEELVERLHAYFTAFDEVVTRYGLEKLKTIGDSYMCVAGLPVRTSSHPVDAVMAAFEMVRRVEDLAGPAPPLDWRVRIGIHTGPVVAGVVGIKKFAFDVWGDTVNFASRMESSGAPNRINISYAASRRIKDFFALEARGGVRTKDNREMDMFFVNGVLPSLLDGNADGAPPAFRRRYRTYFEKDLAAFPPSLLPPSAV